MEKVIKGYKIRIYPNKQQKELINKHIGSCRFIWNYMLNLHEEEYKNTRKMLSGYSMSKYIKPLRNTQGYEWLKEISFDSLTQVCLDLHECYKMFLKKNNNRPTYKSKKKNDNRFPINSHLGKFYFKDSCLLHIPMLGNVKYKTDLKLPLGNKIKFSNVRLTKIANKYIISFALKSENQAIQANDYNLGIDLGIKELAVISYDKDKSIVFHNINKSKKMKILDRKLKMIQRAISRKYEANKQGNKYIKTNNIIRLEEKLRKLYCKISNIRDNYIHQITHKVILLKPKTVIMESLNVCGMMKNKHLSEAIAQQNFYKFITYMKYKCEWNGIEFIQVDRFYPSSKKCSCCGNVKKDLKLSDRIYKCNCGLEIDRDLNAAINLKNYVA